MFLRVVIHFSVVELKVTKIFVFFIFVVISNMSFLVPPVAQKNVLASRVCCSLMITWTA